MTRHDEGAETQCFAPPSSTMHKFSPRPKMINLGAATLAYGIDEADDDEEEEEEEESMLTGEKAEATQLFGAEPTQVVADVATLAVQVQESTKMKGFSADEQATQVFGDDTATIGTDDMGNAEVVGSDATLVVDDNQETQVFEDASRDRHPNRGGGRGWGRGHGRGRGKRSPSPSALATQVLDEGATQVFDHPSGAEDEGVTQVFEDKQPIQEVKRQEPDTVVMGDDNEATQVFGESMDNAPTQVFGDDIAQDNEATQVVTEETDTPVVEQSPGIRTKEEHKEAPSVDADATQVFDGGDLDLIPTHEVNQTLFVTGNKSKTQVNTRLSCFNNDATQVYDSASDDGETYSTDDLHTPAQVVTEAPTRPGVAQDIRGQASVDMECATQLFGEDGEDEDVPTLNLDVTNVSENSEGRSGLGDDEATQVSKIVCYWNAQTMTSMILVVKCF